MKFCPKCGKHYKDANNFCGTCGVELVQMDPNSVDKTENIRENVSQMAGTIGDKAKEALSAENVQKMKDQAKEALSEENVQKMKDQAKETLSAVKNMDAEKGKQLLDGGINKVKTSKKKMFVPALIIVLIAAIGYYFYYSSDNAQIERIANTYSKLYIAAIKEQRGLTDSEIKEISDIMEPTKLKEEKVGSLKLEQKKADELMRKLDEKAKNNKVAEEKLKRFREETKNASYTIKEIKKNADKADVLVTFEHAGKVNRAKILCGKIDGKWYMGPVYYNEDADDTYYVK